MQMLTENGGDSLTALETLLELKRSGQAVFIDEILGRESLANPENRSLIPKIAAVEASNDYILKDLKDIPPNDAMHLIAKSFVNKSELHKALRDEDLLVRITSVWNLLQTYSFGYTDANGKLVAVATSVDFVDFQNLDVKKERMHPHISENIFPYIARLTDKCKHLFPPASKPGAESLTANLEVFQTRV